MKKLIVVGIIILLVGVSIPSTGVNVEKVYNTSHDGNTLYVGGSGPGNYTKIQDAIDNSSNGDFVFVYNGTYYESIIINKSINLIGEDKESTIIVNFWWEENYIVNITADKVKLSGFTILTSGYNSFAYVTLVIIHSSNNNISDNKIGGYIDDWWERDGITLSSLSNNNTLIRNNISYNRIAIYLIQSNDNVIVGNNFSHHSVCITPYSSNNNTISNNNLIDNVHGIILSNSSYNSITYNYIYYIHCCTCIGIKENSNYNNISYNIIDYVAGWGILIRESMNNSIKFNSLSRCGEGISLWNASENRIISNDILQNREFGIWIGSYDYKYCRNNEKHPFYFNAIFFKFNEENSQYNNGNNTIYHNNFINNTQNAYDEFTNFWDNGHPSGGNYWDDYNGTDNDGDGIGDSPYIIPDNDNKDNYPLMQPFNFELPDPKIVYVDDDFNSTIFGWGYDHFDSIQDGIDSVEEKGTVYVFNGNYYGKKSPPYDEPQVKINKSINLIGENKTKTIIDGTYHPNDVVSICDIDRINFSGFTIRNSGKWRGLEVHSSYNNISNCIVESTAGIVNVGSYDEFNILYGNTFYCLVQFWSANSIFSNNIVITDDTCIYTDIYNATITGNKFFNCSLGIHADGGIYNSKIKDNVFRNISNCAIWTRGLGESKILDNIFYNSEDGIYVVVTGEDSIISGNTFRYCEENCMHLDWCNNFTISRNSILDSKRGILLDFSSSNMIYQNNFQNNTKNADFICFSLNNKWEGNYWDKSRILPYPIFGKLGLFIPLLNFDWHPAKKPYDI